MTLPDGLSLAFRRLAWSNLAAQAAEQIGLAAAPMIAVLSLGAGAAETGLLATVQSLPFLLFSLPAGLLADRMKRRQLMVAAELVRAAALLALPLLLWSGELSLTALALIGALTATGTVVFSVTAPALVPALVERRALAQANTQLELARSLAFAAGPALAGAVVGFAGGGLAFALAAMGSLLAAGLLAGVAEPQAPKPARRHVVADIMEGLAFVRGHALLRPILLTSVFWNLSWFVLQAVYVPFAIHRLGLDAQMIGITLGAYGAGMVAGAVVAPLIARHLRFGQLIVVGPLASVLAAATMLASTALPGPLLPLASFFLFGAGPIMWTIGQMTLRQAVTHAALLGRVSALVMMASAGARPLGAAIGGAVGATFGLDAAVGLAAAGFMVQAGCILFSPVPRLNALPEPVG